MFIEILGMAIGSSMMEDGKKDCHKAKQFERQMNDEEAEEYQTSGNLKKASGFFLAAGSAISFVAEVMNWKK